VATRLYGIVWRWHFLAGMLACPIILVVALTGAVYTFRPELERWTSPEVVEVTPAGAPHTLDELLAVVPKTCTPIGITVPARPDRPSSAYCVEGERHEVILDPYRATILADRDVTGSVLNVVLGLHYDLLLGTPGRLAVEWASSLTALLLLSGAVLWWPRGKRKTGGVWWPRREVRGRQWLRDLHAVVGAYALPVMFAVTATGLMWTALAGEKWWHPLTDDAVHEAWDHPPTSTVVAGAPRIGAEAALRRVRPDAAADPRACWVGLPATADGSYTVFCYHPEDRRPAIASATWIDAYAGTPLLALGWDDRSAFGKLDSVAYPIHIGTILGLPGRIAVCVAALILAALCVTGPWLWWKRRPTGKLGVPPKARRRPYLALAALLVLGVLLPTLGATLVLVAVIELVRWLARGRVSTTPA
jgi:uncharacterized iron-regulated membrane protein